MSLAQAKFLPSPEKMFVNFRGVKLTVSDDMDEHTARAVGEHINTEQTEFQAVMDYVRRGDVMLDIGAGAMTCALLGAHLGARVIAYEPSPALFALAAANLDANPTLHGEAHFGWAVSPDFQMNRGDLRLPGDILDEAAFDEACPADDGMRLAIHTIEPLVSVLQRERPNVVLIETSGMACDLTKALASAPASLKPRTVICRLRPAWEGSEQVNQTISLMHLLDYQLTASYLGCDGYVFQNRSRIDFREDLS